MTASTESLNAIDMDGLRRMWQRLWDKTPHRHIRRKMLEKGIVYKQAQSCDSGFTMEQQARLDKLVKQYKRDPGSFDQQQKIHSSGTILVRIWRGRKYVVAVREHGFEYDGASYSSLSQIATLITGTRWNGRAFFGLKKAGKGARA